jgi:hypothetical protein
MRKGIYLDWESTRVGVKEGYKDGKGYTRKRGQALKP